MRKLIFWAGILIFVLVGIFLMLILSGVVHAEDGTTKAQSQNEQAQETTTPQTDSSGAVSTETATNQETSENKDIGEKISEEKVALKTEAGITPDNPVYFVKDIYQRMTVGNDPEKALNYKEQKIAEARVMVEEGKPQQAEKVLDRALQYSNIVEKEASPEMKDKVQESGAAVENTIKTMEEKTTGDEWKNVREKFDETLKKEKEVGTAAELSAKINELCASLAQLDPLQYADTCKSKDNSPKWMKEQDKQLTAEQEKQAKVFFEKLSQCFESPENCDCRGMGVQKFEDFCLEKSKLAAKCKQGDENSCKEVQSGSDPTDLLPDYLVPVLNQVQGKYTKAQYDMYVPEECSKQGAKTPEECSKVMFKLNAPKECLDAGISSSNADAPRKCAKIMFMQRAPKECIDAGITGEGRDDESKCRQLVGEGNNGAGQKPMSEGGPTTSNQPKFNRDCNKIQDSNEKMKCYEEFYNNAQVQFKEDFVQREMTDSRTGEVITPEEENARQQCRSKGMDTILEYKNGKRIILCVDKNQAGGSSGRCQSQNQIENLKQDCKSRGQDANVENRGGCPWVICMGGETERTYAPGTGPSQQTQNRIEQSSGIKCPDGVCDDYEKMNPWACPEDCGGQRTQPPQPQNRIDQPTQPSQQQFCSGQAPSCAPNGAPYCQNGNWVCPQPQQEQQPIQPQPPQQPVQNPPAQPEPQPTPTTTPEPTPAPVTGGVTGRIITSVYGDEATRNGDAFLDYWFNR